VVGEQFGHDQNKSDNSEGDLHSLSPEAPARNWLLPPLRRRPFAERSNSPDHVQIDAGPEDSKHHHGNAYGVLMKSGCRSLGVRSNCSESSQSNDESHAAERHDKSAGALQDNEKKAS